MSRTSFVRLLAAASTSFLFATFAASAQEILKIEDQGAVKKFVLAEDEVLLQGDTTNGERLRDDIEAALPGATVLETRHGEALTRLPQRIDRRKAAARQEAIQQAAPQYPSNPVLYHDGVPRTLGNRRYVGQRVLVELGQGKTLEQLRAETRAARAEASKLPGHALLTFEDGWQSLGASEGLNARGVKARPLLRRYAERMAVPNDPYVLDQWHIKNRGQAGGLVGADANLFQAWDMALGTNVTVVVVDDSLETTHPDLDENTPPANSGAHIDYRSGGTNPSPKAYDDAHGTSVAGVIAARGNNGIGVSGAAPNAQLLGVRLIGGFFDPQTAYDALTWQPAGFTSSVSNNSWGYGGVGMYALDPLERQALVDAATNHRGGLGQVTLFAAANNDRYFNGGGYTSQDANYQPFANSRFVIGVAACTNYGDHSYYSNRGASVLISAPSNGGSLGIFTTDNVGSSGYNSRLDPGGQPTDQAYTNSFGGTSSATPLTSGIVALMLSANPNLGYRDVMEILATTARKIDGTNPDWVTNGAGFDFAHAYGAGMVNAAAAVARASTWTNLPAVTTFSRTAPSLPASIPDASSTSVTRTFDFSNSANLRVEHVEVVIAATHPNRSDLEIAITSPSGTRSILNPIRVRPNVNYTGDDDRDIGSPGNGWVFMTTHHWGENSSGTWTVTARDGRSGSTGTLDSVQVRVYGTPAVPQRLRFAQKLVNVQEDAGTADLVVQRLGQTSTPAQVSYSVVGGSATRDVDYVLANGILSFAPGEAQKTITVSILDDALPESSENVFVVLSNPVGATLGGGSLCTLSISANDGNFVTIAAIDAEAAETPSNVPKNIARFAVTRAVVDDIPLTVGFTIDNSAGSASNGTDYALVSASVTIPAGLDSAFITVTPVDDGAFEGTETVRISLEPADDYALGAPDEATATILDNEIPEVNLLTSSTTLSETGLTNATLTVFRDAPAASELVVDLFIGGSAQPGLDYEALPTSVIIPANSAQTTLPVKPNDNFVFNPARTIFVQLGSKPDYKEGFNKSAEIRLVNDEPAPDAKKPAVTIATPKPKQRFAAGSLSTLPASGLAKDNLKVTSVQFRVNGGDWQAATLPDPPTSWSADLLAHSRPGPNLLEVRAKDEDGNFSLVVSRPFTIVQERSLTVTTVGPGSVTPGSGVFEAGQTYTLKAKPQTGNVFAGWTGDLSGSSKVLTFTMPDADTAVTATFMDNPFADSVIGRYTGPVSGASSLPELTGLLDITVTKTGAFTGKLWYEGIGYPLKGEFSGQGQFSGFVKRAKRVPLAVTLTLDLNPAGSLAITGAIDGNAQPSSVLAKRAGYDAKLKPLNAEFARGYTFYLPPLAPADLSKPQGYGVGTLSVSTAGVVKWAGLLGDGTKAAQSTVLDAQNTWPLYLPLYKGGGYIAGQVAHDTAAAGSDLSAALNWVKPPAPKDRYFPDGFTIEGTSFIGVNYTAPQKGARVLPGYDAAPANSGPLTLSAGNLNPAINKVLKLLPTNVAEILPLGADKLKISISAKTGAVSGSFVFPITRKVTPIKGVILQNKIGKGVGLFPGSTLNSPTLQTGRLDFEPATP
jgi:uncharacterized repeat protein (TIGR02543 family)